VLVKYKNYGVRKLKARIKKYKKKKSSIVQ
jgi:hypothetical protein